MKVSVIFSDFLKSVFVTDDSTGKYYVFTVFCKQTTSAIRPAIGLHEGKFKQLAVLFFSYVERYVHCY